MTTDSETKTVDLGREVAGFRPPVRPDGLNLHGTSVRIEPLLADVHASDLFDAYAGQDQVWDYLPYGPYADFDTFSAWLRTLESGSDPVFFAFCTPEGRTVGMGSYLRIAPDAGSIEVGHLNFSPRMQGTRAATEAMALMMGWAFDAGYRRYEWKCNALNLASRRAAARLGLSYEGVFRQAAVIKGRNRDTAWFAAIDSEWPALKAAFDTWLAPQNFDASGRQKQRLSDLTAPLLYARDPALG